LPKKLYFQSLDKYLLFLLKFFEKPLSEVWLYFAHKQTSSFHETVEKVKGKRVTVFEVIDSISGLKTEGELPQEVSCHCILIL
jgi:hypothetical protein